MFPTVPILFPLSGQMEVLPSNSSQHTMAGEGRKI
jgi:hypothetical protein